MKDETRKRRYIILSVFVFSLAVTFIDAVVQPPYFSKIPIKILFFLALPMLFFVIHRDEWSEFKALFCFRKKGLPVSLLLGFVVFGVILGGYFAARGFIDFSGVTSSLTSGMGITADNFIWVAIYISIMNSFLEEFFFRGFGFITLKKFVNIKFAYLFSPLLFAVYHVGMLVGMFHPAVLALLMLGLIIGGLIFNTLNDSWAISIRPGSSTWRRILPSIPSDSFFSISYNNSNTGDRTNEQKTCCILFRKRCDRKAG